MVGEFLSAGVCQKENGENCSTEAVKDGELTKVKGNKSMYSGVDSQLSRT